MEKIKLKRLFAFIAVCASILLPRVSAAETNIIDFLNDAMAKKPLVERERDVEYNERVCYWMDDSKPCKNLNVKRVKHEKYLDHARITTPQIVSVSALKFDKEKLVGLPETMKIQRAHVYNCYKVPFNGSVSLSVSGSEGWSFSKTNTVGSTTSVTASGSFTYGAASTSLSVSQSLSLSESTTKSEQASTTVTRSYSGAVTLGANEAVDIELMAYQTTIEVPFSATVVVDGELEGNLSGYTRASSLLSEAERTIPFKGTVRVTGVSQGMLGQRKSSVGTSCTGDGVNVSSGESKTDINLQADKVTSGYRRSFGTVKAVQTKENPANQLFSSSNALISTDDIIGPPDGVHYRIISSSEVVRMTPACGYNDVGVPNGGIYTVELREYEQYANGQLSAKWSNTTETFKNCVTGP